jgi:hypothetical protein
MKEITLEGGSKVTLFEPPPGFDPCAASLADVQRYGFPPRPEDPHHLERYRRVFGHLKNKFQYIQPTFRVNAHRIHGPRQRRPGDSTETSTNWSGGVVYAPSGQSFKWIEGDWVVPDVGAPTQNQWCYCASWIGIDGDPSQESPDVCQAGVECEVYQSGVSVTRSIYPWWEWFPGPEIAITNLAISPGDMVTMLICTNQAAGSTSATVFFSNRTTGASTSFGITAPRGYQLVGNSAEWIVEAPTVGGAQSLLADYGEVFFSVCEAFTNTGTTVNGGSGNNINMTSGGNVVSEGLLLTPTVVECLYTGAAPHVARRAPLLRRGELFTTRYTDVQDYLDAIAAKASHPIDASPHGAFWRVDYRTFTTGQVPAVGVPIMDRANPLQSAFFVILTDPNGFQGYPQMPDGGPYVTDTGYSAVLASGRAITGQQIIADLRDWLTHGFPA